MWRNFLGRIGFMLLRGNVNASRTARTCLLGLNIELQRCPAVNIIVSLSCICVANAVPLIEKPAESCSLTFSITSRVVSLVQNISSYDVVHSLRKNSSSIR